MHLQIDAEMRPINMVCCIRSVNTQSRRRRISIYTYICICSCIYLFVYVSVTVSVTLLQSRCLLRHIYRHLAGEDSTLKWKRGKFCSFQSLLDSSSYILYIFMVFKIRLKPSESSVVVLKSSLKLQANSRYVISF